MRFDPWRCPECGEPAYGIQETVPGLALLNFDDDGNAEYESETKLLWWDGQVTIMKEGQVTLEFVNGHAWAATMDSETEAEDIPVDRLP